MFPSANTKHQTLMLQCEYRHADKVPRDQKAKQRF